MHTYEKIKIYSVKGHNIQYPIFLYTERNFLLMITKSLMVLIYYHEKTHKSKSKTVISER